MLADDVLTMFVTGVALVRAEMVLAVSLEEVTLLEDEVETSLEPLPEELEGEARLLIEAVLSIAVLLLEVEETARSTELLGLFEDVNTRLLDVSVLLGDVATELEEAKMELEDVTIELEEVLELEVVAT